jgi:hypothetical protein
MLMMGPEVLLEATVVATEAVVMVVVAMVAAAVAVLSGLEIGPAQTARPTCLPLR